MPAVIRLGRRGFAPVRFREGSPPNGARPDTPFPIPAHGRRAPSPCLADTSPEKTPCRRPSVLRMTQPPTSGCGEEQPQADRSRSIPRPRIRPPLDRRPAIMSPALKGGRMRKCMDAENLHRRMKKLMGQLQAIDQMIDKDVPCEDILIQINAVKGALHRTRRHRTRGCRRHHRGLCQGRGTFFPSQLAGPARLFFCSLLDYLYPYRYLEGQFVTFHPACPRATSAAEPSGTCRTCGCP